MGWLPDIWFKTEWRMLFLKRRSLGEEDQNTARRATNIIMFVERFFAMSRWILLFVMVAVGMPSWSLAGERPTWTVGPLPGSAAAEPIRSQDILARPSRPLHVYGNTVRWMHYRRNGR